ncbi:hypothetical protein [Pontiella sulfatireligans]|uniref:Uncharacterized protein n=1 Tax=Pontiella sulfatireligans TaxID=2750658 RepID=A0A6C2USC5_9BACT|nr:hypothetical protein [Pontiella sulfatireligans]VGO23232.1 hypothetical protein SCARR_05339 [Pontiella sulfatireligans]
MSKMTKIIKQGLAMLTVITFPLAGQATVLWHDTFDRAANGTGNGSGAFSLDESGDGMLGTLDLYSTLGSNTYIESSTGGLPVITTNNTFACELGFAAVGLNYDFTESDLETVASGEFVGQYHMRVSFDSAYYTTGAITDPWDRAIGVGIGYSYQSITEMLNWGLTGPAYADKGLRDGYLNNARNNRGAIGAMFFDLNPEFTTGRLFPKVNAFINQVRTTADWGGMVNGESSVTVDFFFDGAVDAGTVVTYFFYIEGSYAPEISGTYTLVNNENYVAFGTRGATTLGAGFDNLKIETFSANPRPPMLTSVASGIQLLTDTWTLINPSTNVTAVLSNQSESGYTAFLPDIPTNEAARHPIVLQGFDDRDISQIGQSFSYDFDVIVDDVTVQDNSSFHVYIYDTNSNYCINTRLTWGPAGPDKNFQVRIGPVMSGNGDYSNANVVATDYLSMGNIYTNYIASGDFFGRTIPGNTDSGMAASLWAGLKGDNDPDFVGISDSTVVVHVSGSISRIETNKLFMDIAWGDSVTNAGQASYTLREDWGFNATSKGVMQFKDATTPAGGFTSLNGFGISIAAGDSPFQPVSSGSYTITNLVLGVTSNVDGYTFAVADLAVDGSGDNLLTLSSGSGVVDASYAVIATTDLTSLDPWDEIGSYVVDGSGVMTIPAADVPAGDQVFYAVSLPVEVVGE